MMRGPQKEVHGSRPEAKGKSCAAHKADQTLSCQACEAVCTPFFTAYTVVDKKKTHGIIFRLYCLQSRIIRSPEGFLPGLIEEIAFRYIGARHRHNRTQFICSGSNGNRR